MVLSTFIIGLVSHAFLVQNQYYSTQTLRTSAQDNVRTATELMAREIRTTAGGGVVVAGARTLTIRSPIAVGVVCGQEITSGRHIHTEGGPAGFDSDEVGGVAVRSGTTWTFQNTTWAAINGSDSQSATRCYDNGADTTGAYSEFHRLNGLDVLFGTAPNEGDLVMLFRETTFKIQASQLDPTTLGLFRSQYGGALTEFATGIDATAQFQYRTGGASYADTIPGAAIDDIDAIRIVADARLPAPTGGQDDVRFGWSVNVALRNIQ
jgi:hypothetical protein